MELNYAIFRSEPIMTIPDLAGIGSHNKREKKAYQSNKDININLSKNNIELVPLNVKYVKGFDEITKEYKKEHDERMKVMRVDRKKRYHEMLNSSKNCVADELVMTASPGFFKDMNREQIKEWANTCMEFVYKDLGYKKEQVLHATVHMDEKTPHIHCVVVPLVKKLDKRTNTERYTISKKQYIKDKIHLSQLQDKYHARLTKKGFDLERGIKGSDAEHLKTKELKKATKYYENKVETINKGLDKAISDLDDKMQSKKNPIFDKEYVKVKRETFDSMNNVIKETKKAIEFQPKLEQLFNEVNNFTKSHQTLEKENQSMQIEIKSLKTKNSNLIQENSNLKSYIKAILEAIKHFFRELLQIGNETTKEATTSEIKEYFDNQDFDMVDIKNISKGTTKEDELYDYAGVPSYLKTGKKSYDDREKDDFEMSL